MPKGRWAGIKASVDAVEILARQRQFDLAWSHVLHSPQPHPFSSYVALVRRYARCMPHAAVRTWHFLCRHPQVFSNFNLERVSATNARSYHFPDCAFSPSCQLDENSDRVSACGSVSVSFLASGFNSSDNPENDSACKGSFDDNAINFQACNAEIDGNIVSSSDYSGDLDSYPEKTSACNGNCDYQELSFGQSDPFEILLDALCKEGHARVAADCFAKRQEAELQLGWTPSTRCYNILLHGWFRAQRPRKAESIWLQMQRDGVTPDVVTYGTLIEGLCSLRRPDEALTFLEEMRSARMKLNYFTCNPIVDALSEAGRFKEAMGFLEKFSLFGISPNISTFNVLVKGFCKHKDLAGASNILKMMIGMGVLPTATTYNYFFLHFSKFGMIEEGMNLYTKMVDSGYLPDRVTYQLLIKMLCEKQRLTLAIQMIKEMNQNGYESDLATSTMLVHLLSRLRRFNEACEEFDSMIKRGIVPQFITYHRLVKELKKMGMVDLQRKVIELMNSVPHSSKLPGTCREKEGDENLQLRKSIMKRAEEMSETLKACKSSKERSNSESSADKDLESAYRLIEDIRRRYYAVKG